LRRLAVWRGSRSKVPGILRRPISSAEVASSFPSILIPSIDTRSDTPTCSIDDCRTSDSFQERVVRSKKITAAALGKRKATEKPVSTAATKKSRNAASKEKKPGKKPEPKRRCKQLKAGENPRWVSSLKGVMDVDANRGSLIKEALLEASNTTKDPEVKARLKHAISSEVTILAMHMQSLDRN